MKVSKYQNIKINLIFEIYGHQNNLHFNREIQQNEHIDPPNKYRVILLKEQVKMKGESHVNNTLKKVHQRYFHLNFYP